MRKVLARSFALGKTRGMRKWLPLISICLGTFMLLIDVTIVNVALPSMASSLRTSFTQLQWVVDIYALALAALLLGVGSASDLLGRRNVYICGLVVFALASLTAGISGSTAMLIAARGIQGIGAAAMFATTIALINSSYSGPDRGVAFGVWGAFNGAAAATGPILGGLLTQGLSWRWIFFVNLPISVVAIAVSVYGLAPDRPARRGRIDVWGVAAFTAGAGSVTLALTRVSENGWTSVTTLGLIGFGLVALLTFIAVERRSARPILDLALLRRRSFSGVLAGALLLSVAAFADLAYISLWLQSVRAMGPIHAGLTVLPLGACSLLVSLSVGRFLHGSPRWTISGGLALIGAGTPRQRPPVRRIVVAEHSAGPRRRRDRRRLRHPCARLGSARRASRRPRRDGRGSRQHRPPARLCARDRRPRPDLPERDPA